VCASEEDGLPQAGIVCSYCLSCRCYLAEVVGAFDLGGGWVQRVGEPLEPSGGLLDFFVRVSAVRVCISHSRMLCWQTKYVFGRSGYALHPARRRAGRVVSYPPNVLAGALACSLAPVGVPTRNAWNGTDASPVTSGSTALPAATIPPARRAIT
jgi:hypothetical protein